MSRAPRSPLSASASPAGDPFHGLALNVDLDLAPFAAIDPCGFPGLKVTRLSDWISPPSWGEIENALVRRLSRQLGLSLSLSP